MILLHQIWNQRRQNLWIFIELLIAGFFLWMVIDPIYVLTANRLIPQGGDTRGMYVLNLGQYDKSFGEYDPTQDSAQVMFRHYQDIVRAVRTCPEVEAFTVSAYSSFPNSMSWSGMELFNEDSVRVHVQQYRFIPLDGSDLPKTYGMVDVRTGQPVTLPADFAQRRMIALSERAARDLFGTTDAVGLTVYESSDRENPHEVAAVFCDYKHYTSEQPYPMAVLSEENFMMAPFTANIYHIVFRLKDGVDADAFETRFRAEVAPQLSRGNFYFDSLKTFGDYSRQNALSSGVTNKLRLQYALGGFALLCIFLGMVGTFYIRANARREEVGILRAMGVSRAGIVRRFLAESWILVTVAYALALLVVGNYVYAAGFAEGINAVNITKELVPDPAYPQNRPWPHFLSVTVLTYAVLLLTALVGTWIPVRRAARILPVDALREE